MTRVRARVRGRVSARASARVRGGRLRAWAELLRLPALFTVPGDALAGAAAVGARPGRGTFLAIGSSLCLYEAGMALNDWADRAEDAVDRPHRPIPSGRIHPAAALTAAGAFTAAGLCLAFRAGRTTGALSTALAATVWAYDLGLKHTPAGPVAMGAARGLDVLLGASASHTPSYAGRETRETPDTREGHGALRSGTGGGREVASAGRGFGLRRGAAGTVGASSGVRVAVRSGAGGGGEVACAGREFGPLKDAAGAVGAGSGVRAALLFGEGRGAEAACAGREFGPLKDAAGAVGAGSGVRAALLFGEGR
ncbi:UbiA family prenyltransferase, partial [Streptomyces sp. NPDC050095]|uniref:UbiA family prenyltransferase n=2 Tax=unclassified Streptomyces TaxID=2593676 RepID=UPI003417DC30